MKTELQRYKEGKDLFEHPLEPVESLNLKESADKAFVVKTDKGLWFFEPELKTQFKMVDDFCRLSQRRMKPLSFSNNRSLEGQMFFTANIGAFTPMFLLERGVRDRLKLWSLYCLGDMSILPVQITTYIREKCETFVQELEDSDSPQGRTVLIPGSRLSLRTGFGNRSMRNEEGSIYSFGVIESIHVVHDFVSDSDIEEKSRLPLKIDYGLYLGDFL